MIRLGGNISLEGFEIVDKTELLIIKKLVGNYIHDFQESIGNNITTTIILESSAPNYSVLVKIVSSDKEFEGSAEGSNLFMTLDSAMKKVIDSL